MLSPVEETQRQSEEEVFGPGERDLEQDED